MDKAKKAANFGQCRNYQQEAEMESRVNAGEQSYAKAGTEGKDKSELNTNCLLEAILERDNLNAAYKRVKQNAGSPGVDKMKVEALLPFLRQHGESLKQSIIGGTYKPQPVLRVEIDKPDGGVRLLGIPTVTDRLLQQAVGQVLAIKFEMVFEDYSYGFRPNRNAHQAIKQAQGVHERRDTARWTIKSVIVKCHVART